MAGRKSRPAHLHPRPGHRRGVPRALHPQAAAGGDRGHPDRPVDAQVGPGPRLRADAGRGPGGLGHSRSTGRRPRRSTNPPRRSAQGPRWTSSTPTTSRRPCPSRWPASSAASPDSSGSSAAPGIPPTTSSSCGHRDGPGGYRPDPVARRAQPWGEDACRRSRCRSWPDSCASAAAGTATGWTPDSSKGE